MALSSLLGLIYDDIVIPSPSSFVLPAPSTSVTSDVLPVVVASAISLVLILLQIRKLATFGVVPLYALLRLLTLVGSWPPLSSVYPSADADAAAATATAESQKPPRSLCERIKELDPCGRMTCFCENTRKNKSMKWYHTFISNVLRMGPIPKHVAFIMDGNRRFARKNCMNDTMKGHTLGFDILIESLEWCLSLGIETVTVYAFSVDNFNRPKKEVEGLMDLAKAKFQAMARHKDTIHQNGVRVQVLGNIELLPVDVRDVLERAAETTKQNSNLILNICMAYSSQLEIQEAMDALAAREKQTRIKKTEPEAVKEVEIDEDDESEETKKEVEEAKVEHEDKLKAGVEEKDDSDTAAAVANDAKNDVHKSNTAALNHDEQERHAINVEHGEEKRFTEEALSSHLFTGNFSDPDILVRTSGETRLSDFLLWQVGFSQLSFIQPLWPEFNFFHFASVILDYQRAFPQLTALREMQGLSDSFAGNTKNVARTTTAQYEPAVNVQTDVNVVASASEERIVDEGVAMKGQVSGQHNQQRMDVVVPAPTVCSLQTADDCALVLPCMLQETETWDGGDIPAQ